MNYDSGLGSDPSQQDSQIAPSECDTAGRWPKPWASDMDKDRAPPAGDAWPIVVVDFHNDVIEAVGPAETIS